MSALIEAAEPGQRFSFAQALSRGTAPTCPGRSDGPLEPIGDTYLGDGSTQLAAALQRRYPALKIKALYSGNPSDGALEHTVAYDPQTDEAHDARGSFPTTAAAFDGFGAGGDRTVTRNEAPAAAIDPDADAYVQRNWGPFEDGSGQLGSLIADYDPDDEELDAVLGGEPRAATTTSRVLDESALTLLEAVWNEQLHPRWPPGSKSPTGKHISGEFMRVGQRFDLNGQEWEIGHIAGNQIIAHEASGDVGKAETRVFDTKQVGDVENALPGATPAAPRVLKSGFGSGKTTIPDENSLVVDADRHTETHDPSIPLNPLSKLTPEQWSHFGLVDQLYYNSVMEHFGAWEVNGQKPPPISSSGSQWGAKLAALTKDAPPDAVSTFNKEVTSLKGATRGNQLSGVNVFKGLYGDPQKLAAAQEKYARFKEYEGDVNALLSWDLYNRLGEPDITVIHRAGGAEVFKKALGGHTSVLSGLSTSWKTGSWSEPNSFVFAMPVRQVAFFESLLGQGWGAGSGESELANADRLKIGKLAGYYLSHEVANQPGSGQAGKMFKWLTGQLNKNGYGGGLAGMLKKHFNKDDPYTVDLGPVDANFKLKKAAGQKTYFIPPDSVMSAIEDKLSADPGHPAWDEQKPVSSWPEDMQPKPGMIITKGGQQEGTRYLVIQNDALGPGEIQYVPLLTGTGDYDVNPTGGGFKSTKAKVVLGDNGKPLFFPLPPPPKDQIWSHDMASLAPSGPKMPVGTMNVGDDVEINNDHWKITKKTSSLITLQSLSDGSEGTVESLWQTQKLYPTGQGVPDEAPAPTFTPEIGQPALYKLYGGDQLVNVEHVDPTDPAFGEHGSAQVTLPDGSLKTVATIALTQPPALPTLTPEKGDTFVADGIKHTVTNVMKDGTVRARPFIPGGPTQKVVSFHPNAEDLKTLIRPGDYEHGEKAKLGSIAPGTLVSGSPSVVRPYMVLGTTGTKTHLKNLDTGEITAVSKNKSYPTLVNKHALVATPHDQWQPGDKVDVSDLQPGDKFQMPGGEELTLTGEATQQGTVGWQYATSGGSTGWMPKDLGESLGLKATYLGKTEPTTTTPGVDPSILQDAVSSGEMEPFYTTHSQLHNLPEGQHFTDQNGKLWKVKQQGQNPIITDGETLYTVKGTYHGKPSVDTLDDQTAEPGPSFAKPSPESAPELTPNTTHQSLADLKVQPGDKFNSHGHVWTILSGSPEQGGYTASADDAEITKTFLPFLAPTAYQKAAPELEADAQQVANEFLIGAGHSPTDIQQLHTEAAANFADKGYPAGWSDSSKWAQAYADAYMGKYDSALGDSEGTLQMANDLFSAVKNNAVKTEAPAEPEPEPSAAGLPPFLQTFGNPQHPEKSEAHYFDPNELALRDDGTLVYLKHSIQHGDHWTEVGGDAVDIPDDEKLTPVSLGSNIPLFTSIKHTGEKMDVHDMPVGQTFFVSGTPWILLGHGSAGADAKNLESGTILNAPAGQHGKFELGDWKPARPGAPTEPLPAPLSTGEKATGAGTVPGPGIHPATTLVKGHHMKIKTDGKGAEYEVLETPKPGDKTIKVQTIKGNKVYDWKHYNKNILITKAAPAPTDDEMKPNPGDSMTELGLQKGDFFGEGGNKHKIKSVTPLGIQAEDQNGITTTVHKDFVPETYLKTSPQVPVEPKVPEPEPSPPSAPIPANAPKTFGDLNVGDKYKFDQGEWEVTKKTPSTVTVKYQGGAEDTLPIDSTFDIPPTVTYKAPPPTGGNAAGQLGGMPGVADLPIDPYLWPKSGTQTYTPLNKLQPGAQFSDKSGAKHTVIKHNPKKLEDATATTTVQGPSGGTFEVPQKFVNAKGKTIPTRVNKLSTTAPVPEFIAAEPEKPEVPGHLTEKQANNLLTNAATAGGVQSTTGWNVFKFGDGYSVTSPDGTTHGNLSHDQAHGWMTHGIDPGPVMKPWSELRVGDLIKVGGAGAFKVTADHGTQWEITSKSDGSVTDIPKNSVSSVQLTGHESKTPAWAKLRVGDLIGVGDAGDDPKPSYKVTSDLGDQWEVTNIAQGGVSKVNKTATSKVTVFDHESQTPSVADPGGTPGAIAQSFVGGGSPGNWAPDWSTSDINGNVVFYHGHGDDKLAVAYRDPDGVIHVTPVHYKSAINDVVFSIKSQAPDHVEAASQQDLDNEINGTGEKVLPHQMGVGDVIANGGHFRIVSQNPEGTLHFEKLSGKGADEGDLPLATPMKYTLVSKGVDTPPTADASVLPQAGDDEHFTAINTADTWMLNHDVPSKTANWVHTQAAKYKQQNPGVTWGDAYHATVPTMTDTAPLKDLLDQPTPAEPVIEKLPPAAPKPAAGEMPDYTGTDLTPLGSAGGTTGAQLATDPTGKQWLIKSYGGNENRVATELLANSVYRTVGLHAADAGTLVQNGKTKLAYPLVDGQIKNWSGKDQAKMHALGQGIMTDALVGNWDFAGLEDDNVLWNGDEPTRIDQGGTFQYRAQGKPKPYGPVPVEVKSLLTGYGQGVKGVSVSLQDMREQAQHIAQELPPEKIDQLVNAAPFADQKMKDEIRTNLKARVQWMQEFADGFHGDMVDGVKLASGPKVEPAPPAPPAQGDQVTGSQMNVGDVFEGGGQLFKVTDKDASGTSYATLGGKYVGKLKPDSTGTYELYKPAQPEPSTPTVPPEVTSALASFAAQYQPGHQVSYAVPGGNTKIGTITQDVSPSTTQHAYQMDNGDTVAEDSIAGLLADEPAQPKPQWTPEATGTPSAPHVEDMPIDPYLWPKGGVGKSYQPIASLKPGAEFTDKAGTQHRVLHAANGVTVAELLNTPGKTVAIPHSFIAKSGKVHPTRVNAA